MFTFLSHETHGVSYASARDIRGQECLYVPGAKQSTGIYAFNGATLYDILRCDVYIHPRITAKYLFKLYIL